MIYLAFGLGLLLALSFMFTVSSDANDAPIIENDEEEPPENDDDIIDCDEDDDGDVGQPDPEDDDDNPDGGEIIGTEEDDILRAGLGNDTLFGLDGDDLLLGGPGDNLLDGGPGNDTLDGGAGVNTLLGGAGDDVLNIREACGMGSIFDGGEGTDRLDASAFDQRLSLEIGPGGGTISHDVQNPDEPTDFVQETGIFRNIEIFDLPDAPNNYVQFLPGAEAVRINGGDGGNDVFDIAAAHTVSGGAGDDLFSVSEFVTGLEIDGAGGSNMIEGELPDGASLRFFPDGSAGLFEFVFNEGPVQMARIDNVDRWLLFAEDAVVDGTFATQDLEIELRNGVRNEIYGGSGNDVLIGNGFLFGGAGDDTLIGSGSLSGGDGNDLLIAGDEDTLLDGGPGDDTLIGGAGADTLIGGDGNNVMIGSTQDIFISQFTLDFTNRIEIDIDPDVPGTALIQRYDPGSTFIVLRSESATSADLDLRRGPDGVEIFLEGRLVAVVEDVSNPELIEVYVSAPRVT